MSSIHAAIVRTALHSFECFHNRIDVALTGEILNCLLKSIQFGVFQIVQIHVFKDFAILVGATAAALVVAYAGLSLSRLFHSFF